MIAAKRKKHRNTNRVDNILAKNKRAEYKVKKSDDDYNIRLTQHDIYENYSEDDYGN